MTVKSHSKKTLLPKSAALTAVLRQAKQLHRAAHAPVLVSSLPILRRLLGAGVLKGISLPELQRHRNMVQRKHLLQLLAVEAGCASWEAYRQVLLTVEVEQLEDFDLLKGQYGYPNLWFPSVEEAQQYAQQQGGRVVRVGKQAVILDVTQA